MLFFFFHVINSITLLYMIAFVFVCYIGVILVTGNAVSVSFRQEKWDVEINCDLSEA